MASARSVLLTLLGEFVLPREVPVWSGALVAGLAEAGVEEKAARQALSRTANEDLLVAERHGRRVRWALSAAGERLLAEGTERIYGFGQGLVDWDGRWLVLAVSVPETQRQLRHRLRTRLTWLGLGSPLPGVWVTPDTGRDKQVEQAVAELGVEAFSFTGPFGPVGDPLRVVRHAWQLDRVQETYLRFLTDFRSEQAVSPGEAFRRQLDLVGDWRRFPFLDPGLPAPLLPPTWPGRAAAQLFHRRRDAWHAAAQQHWDELSAAAAARS